jgi:hypothetical protein
MKVQNISLFFVSGTNGINFKLMGNFLDDEKPQLSKMVSLLIYSENYNGMELSPSAIRHWLKGGHGTFSLCFKI